MKTDVLVYSNGQRFSVKGKTGLRMVAALRRDYETKGNPLVVAPEPIIPAPDATRVYTIEQSWGRETAWNVSTN